MGGVIVDGGTFDWSAKPGKYPMLSEPRPEYNGVVLHQTFGNFAFAIACRVLGLRDLGPAIAPMNAFLLLTGIETLPLRMQRHCDNAMKVATWLKSHPKVAWVIMPACPTIRTTPCRSAIRQRRGSVFTFGIKGGLEAGKALVGGLKLFSHLANIGDTRSLIIHPASTTHAQLSEAQQIAAGADLTWSACRSASKTPKTSSPISSRRWPLPDRSFSGGAKHRRSLPGDHDEPVLAIRSLYRHAGRGRACA